MEGALRTLTPSSSACVAVAKEPTFNSVMECLIQNTYHMQLLIVLPRNPNFKLYPVPNKATKNHSCQCFLSDVGSVSSNWTSCGFCILTGNLDLKCLSCKSRDVVPSLVQSLIFCYILVSSLVIIQRLQRGSRVWELYTLVSLDVYFHSHKLNICFSFDLFHCFRLEPVL